MNTDPKIIVCYGDLVADLVMQIERLPIVPEQAQNIRKFSVEPGGAGNFLITAARMGGQCVALGAIGEDANGNAIFAMLRAENIDMGYAQRGAGSVNVIVLVFVDEAGQHVFLAHDGKGAPFQITPREEQLIRSAGVFFVPGYALVEERMAGAALQAVSIAHAANVPIMNDLGPIVTQSNLRESAERVVRHSAVTFLTADEAMIFTGTRDYRAAAQALQALGSRTSANVVVIKRGAQGCVVFDGDRASEIAGIPVFARDTTGAGDTFAGAFATEWLRNGGAVLGAARFANLVAAAKVQKVGSGRQCPTAADVENLKKQIQQHE
jgi:sugar/nucleoside kinase (ribokinase family)